MTGVGGAFRLRDRENLEMFRWLAVGKADGCSLWDGFRLIGSTVSLSVTSPRIPEMLFIIPACSFDSDAVAGSDGCMGTETASAFSFTLMTLADGTSFLVKNSSCVVKS